MSTGDNKRRKLIDVHYKHIIGSDPSRIAGADAEQAQSFQIATAVKQWFDSGYDPINLIRMLLAGACFVADNCDVSREQMVQVIRQAKIMRDRQLIYKPEGE